MKTTSLVLLSASVLSLTTSGLRAADTIPNRLIDYAGFQKIVDTAGPQREKMRLTEEQFLAAMKESDVVILDARTAERYKMRHIKGAISLPFTEFTADTLAAVLPAKTTRVLIYCNNNFLGSPAAFASKSAPASLNLSTYTSLKAYGYDNINELGPLLEVDKTKIPFEGSEVKADSK